MILLLSAGSCDDAATVVSAALQRSCGCGQVRRITPALLARQLAQAKPVILVVLDPPDLWADLVIRTLGKSGNKVLLFGSLPPRLAKHLGARVQPMGDTLRNAAGCEAACTGESSESSLRVEYREIDETLRSPLTERPFLRYDFADEWNNLGYGAIRNDDSIWAIGQRVDLARENCLAQVVLERQEVTAYAGLWREGLLWFNRPVGPVDSQEWRIVELFLFRYAWPERTCQPVLREVPADFDAAVTMRLDCDEEVESARGLWRLYRELDVPFSLALLGSLLADERHHRLPREVLAQGGAILSHSTSHAADWGGCYQAAFREAVTSARQIEAVTGQAVRYAVSPFHQTPGFARAALADAGYQGCIGGIIRDDPDFLMARAGPPPGSASGFIGHSQQCMLHGDCLAESGDPLAIYRRAFELARASHSFFGYSDHPFSQRYQYGWRSEDQRMQSHRDFIHHIRSSGGRVLFANEEDALDFLQDRAEVAVQEGSAGFMLRPPASVRSSWRVAVDYAGRLHALPDEGITL